jgi:hypothetical protein
VLACLAVAAACTSDPDRDADVAGAYVHIIEWVAARATPLSDQPVVFVIALGEGFDIDLSLQAAILHDSSDDLDVQFLDDRSEAFDEDDDIRDGGVLLEIGPAKIDGDHVVIEGDEVRSADDATSWQFELRADDEGAWTFVGSPVPADS